MTSTKLWKTKQNRHIVAALARSACDISQDISFRKSKRNLSKTACVDSLIASSTIWNLKHAEEHHLETMQQQFVESVLKEHGETLDKHGFLPPPSEQSACEVAVDDEDTSETIDAEVEALYAYFTGKHRKNEKETEANGNGGQEPCVPTAPSPNHFCSSMPKKPAKESEATGD